MAALTIVDMPTAIVIQSTILDKFSFSIFFLAVNKTKKKSTMIDDKIIITVLII